MATKTVLITGAARRVGRAIAERMHALGWHAIIHCHRSQDEARQLADTLNAERANSASVVCADLADAQAVQRLVDELGARDDLDAIVNNASAFFPTPLADYDAYDAQQWQANWDALLSVNAKAPLLLALGLRETLKARQGAVVNIVDIHADRPLKDYALYSISKAAIAMATRVLARELAPQVRCNGVSPGAILWPEVKDYETNHQAIIRRTALKREGTPEDIAKAVAFLLRDAPYITGQIIAVDGGRTLSN